MTGFETPGNLGEKSYSEEFPLYLDHQATTPLDPRVHAAMQPWWLDHFGNPHSADHAYGRKAAAAVENARSQVAALLSANPQEIVFTSGATEANNLALQGVLHFNRRYGVDRDHLMVSAIEHKCVLEAAKALAEEGFPLTILPVNSNGMVDLDTLRHSLTPRTAIVSVMAANNEIGVIQSIADIGALCRKAGALFHCDAAQAVGRIPLHVEEMGIDLLSLSGHKIGGPKGVGAMYLRWRPRVRLQPLFFGGGQERGLRSGTLPVPLCVGLGKAAQFALTEGPQESARQRGLRDYFWRVLSEVVPGVILNGDSEHRLPCNLNFSLPDCGGHSPLARLRSLALSAGSACSSAGLDTSYVLRAIGLSEDRARSSVRFSIGRTTTKEDIEFALRQFSLAFGRGHQAH